MNYRHSYHAGNFADVFKHCVLTALIQALHRKDTPMCYLDTHAGLGIYDLDSATAKKTGEFKNGIDLIPQQPNPPAIVARYLAAIESLKGYGPRLYPGSPYLAQYLLRPQDRMVLCELHPKDVEELKRVFAKDKQVAVHHQDGYLGLKAFLPPKERRGLVLIDPSYEEPDELKQLTTGLKAALQRWDSGVYAVWYPVKDRVTVNKLHKALEKLAPKNLLITEITVLPDDVPTRLNGSGMAIINAPWQFDREIYPIVTWLWKALSVNKQGSYKLEYLRKE